MRLLYKRNTRRDDDSDPWWVMLSFQYGVACRHVESGVIGSPNSESAKIIILVVLLSPSGFL
jgi:hypothetical protein